MAEGAGGGGGGGLPGAPHPKPLTIVRGVVQASGAYGFAWSLNP